MIIEYTPEGGEKEVLDAGRLRASEIQLVERTADMTWGEVKGGLMGGNVTARRTVAWALKKRTQPGLRLAEFDPFEDELVVRLDAAEVRAYAAEIHAEYADKPEQMQAAFDELREAAFDAEACELAIKEAQTPKGPDPAPAATASGSPAVS
ncbi:hypothetical protein [Streptomyces longispororuber]|uniref:hypothetical protein n=1 Tax=Streptomyces longispororuber TaxID=68230 RepID=UPI0036FD6859